MMGDKKKLVVLTPSQAEHDSIQTALNDGLSPEHWTVQYWSSAPECTSQYLDSTNRRQLQECFAGAHTCIIMTYCDFSKPKETEVEQGIAIGNACRAAGVNHVILSGQLHCEKTIGIPAKHFDAKAEIFEDFRRRLALPITMVAIPPYYEIFMSYLRPQMHVSGGGYEILLPSTGAAPTDMMSVDDLGSCLLPMVDNPQIFINKTVSLSGDKMSGETAARTFNDVLSPKRFFHKQITIQEFRDKGFEGSIDLANMFDLLSRTDMRISPNGTKELHPDVQNFASWSAIHRETLMLQIA